MKPQICPRCTHQPPPKVCGIDATLGTASFLFKKCSTPCKTFRIVFRKYCGNATVYSNDLVRTNELSSDVVKVYPNPTSEPATVTWTNNEFNTLTILNAGGQTIEHMDIAMQNSFQTKRLKPGIYFINLSNQNQYTATQKLVVQ